MSKRIRIKDIAEKAQVSTGTVDRVLHNRGRVSEDARKKVLEAMEELSYRPNLIASALAYNKTWRIAVLIPNPENDAFWQQPLRGIERGFQSVQDYGIALEYFYYTDGDTEDFVKKANMVIAGQFDALLAAPLFSKEGHEFFDKCDANGIKYVQINTFLERSDESFLCYIGQKSFDSGVLAAKLLDFGTSAGETVMVLHLEKEVYNSMHLVQKERGFEAYFDENPKAGVSIAKASYPNVEDKVGFELFLKEQFQQYPNLNGIFITTSKIFNILPILETLNKIEVKLVGFDLIDANLGYLEQNKINFLINQNPLKQGFLGIINIFNHLILKKKIKPIQYLPLDVVMKENMEYYVEKDEDELHLMF